MRAKPLPICASLLAAGFLTACGFHPLYGTVGTGGPSVGAMLANVYVEPISDRVGYDLRNDLLDLFDATGSPEGAAYRLKVTLMQDEESAVLQPDASITRYNYVLTAHYELTQTGTTKVVEHGDVSALTAYNVASAPYLYATVAAQRDAHDRAAQDVAERLRTVLAVYLRNTALKANAAS